MEHSSSKERRRTCVSAQRLVGAVGCVTGGVDVEASVGNGFGAGVRGVDSGDGSRLIVLGVGAVGLGACTIDV